MDDVSSVLELKNFECIADTEKKVMEFIHDIKNKEHCILIFQNDNMRDKIVNEFIDPKYAHNTITACFTHDVSKYSCNKLITYDELAEKKKLLPNKISEFLITVLDESYEKNTPRVACEDTAWFSEAGFFEEHQKIGNSLDKKIIDESAILCCYNETKLNDNQMDVVLDSRNYVILEKPFSVYRK